MFEFDPLKQQEKRFFQWVKRVFPERELLLRRDGLISCYRIPSYAQFSLSVFLFLFLGWVGFSSAIYFMYDDLLSSQEKRVTEARQAFANLATEVTLYQTNIEKINQEIEQDYGKTVELLDTTQMVTADQKEEMLKNRRRLTFEMTYMGDKLDKLVDGLNWTRFARMESGYKLKEAELQRDVALAERYELREKNKELEQVMADMHTTQLQVLEKVENLADNGIGNVETTISKIERSLSKIGINPDDLIKRTQENGVGQGGPFIPLPKVDFKDAKMNTAFTSTIKKIEYWEGIKKVETMLPLGNPVKEVRMTSNFGPRVDPFNNQHSMHTGVDFSGRIGTAVYTPSAGRVIQAGTRGAYGQAVEIDHGLGFTTLYAHLSKVNVKVGQWVDVKQKIAQVGNTGRSTAAHLHYELRYRGNPVNPRQFVEARHNVL